MPSTPAVREEMVDSGFSRTVTEHGWPHPLRWRKLTWYIVAVDAFGVGFLVGLLVGYRRVSPLGAGAEEGVAMVVFLTVAIAFLLNVGLALAWVDHRRHRPAASGRRCGRPSMDSAAGP